MTTRIYSPGGELLEERPGTVPLHAGARSADGTPLDMAPPPELPASHARESESINEGRDKTDEREAAILAAIVTLSRRAEPADWTADGLPKAEALAELTGWPVSDAERDAVFAIVNEED